MQTTTRRTVICIDTRRTINVLAASRKPKDVAKEGHEQFIRNALKDKMGWPRREPAPESIKVAAKQMAAVLMQRDKEIAAKLAAEKAEAEATKAALAEFKQAAEEI